MDPVDRLRVLYELDDRRYREGMRRMSSESKRSTDQIVAQATRAEQAAARVGNAIRNFAVGFAGGALGALGVRQLIQMTGAWTDLTSRVNIAAGSMEKGEQVMRRVSEMARRTYSDLNQTAEGYLAFSTTMTELGVSTDRQLDFVESLNNALVVSGAKGEVAARVMDALSKAMALGSLQGDNLNTVIASGGRVSQALAESMGVTTMELRKLGSEGRIGRQEMLGITSEMEKLRREAGEMPATIQDGFMLLNNALLEYVGRGDEAVGMSGRIAEALTMIADNFDTAADAGLKLAAVLAAGMLGRSIIGMVARLGTATGALVQFAAALRAATSLGSVTAAISGLSAAAGPLGMIFGGLLAGGVLLYSDRAREAEQRSKDLRQELQDMGFYAPGAAEALEDVAEAVDGIGTEEQIARIERLRQGLKSLKGDGGSFASWLMGDSSEIGKVVANLELQAGRIFSGESGKIAREVADLTKEYQRGAISVAEFSSRLAAVDGRAANDTVRDLITQLREIAPVAQAAETALAVLGDIPGLDGAIAAVAELRGQMETLANLTGVTDSIQKEIADLIRDFEDGQRSAEDTKAALQAIEMANPDFGPFISKVMAAIGALNDLRMSAIMAGASMAALSVVGGGSAGGGDTSLEQQGAVTEAHIAELRRQNELSRERLDIEKRTERIMQDAAKAGAALTREQAEQLAIEQAAADARRSAEGRSGGRTGSGTGRSSAGGRGRSGREDRPFFEAVEQDLLNLEREITLVGKSAEEVARARAEWAMLDEAKKRGITVDAALNRQIEEQAAAVGRLTAELERAEIAQQQFEQAVDGIADAFAGALVAGESLRDGLAQVFKQIAADLMRSGIRNALLSQFGSGAFGMFGLRLAGGGDALTGALRGAGLNAIPSFDGGGRTGNGPRSGGLDGKGGFLALMHPNETVTDHTKGQRGGSSVSFAPNISIAPGVTQDELAMTFAAARQEYERNFLPLLRKTMPEFNERYG
ncbi:tape measure protein [Paracoccus siganidrum]|uniref:Tape measure protein N-terminal domain-containing protein n=1 Tax=Paracoccus siganidrum TaxID=1276757 RepID=A0A419A3Q5_9RHOB|nr:tape measure protein [Paracoccus siganidrum]RJL08410.1 hypothetical protein D3P05_16195 [Paracoccus siganidrum]RMC39320.1 hypothetical protein C9E82_04905 [Paracoccus siganidrum]